MEFINLPVCPWKVVASQDKLVSEFGIFDELCNFRPAEPTGTKRSRKTKDELILRDRVITEIHKSYSRERDVAFNFPTNPQADELFNARLKKLTGRNALYATIKSALLNLPLHEFMLLRESSEFRKSFYHTSFNVIDEKNWTDVYFDIAKAIHIEESPISLPYEMNRNGLIITTMRRMTTPESRSIMVQELLNIEGAEVEPNLWESNLVYKSSAILLAIELEDLMTLKVLLQKNPAYVNINVYMEEKLVPHPTVGYFTTPLLFALRSSKFEIALYLLSIGANVNAKVRASNRMEDPDYYASAVSLLVSTSENAKDQHFESIFVILCQACSSFEPGLLKKVSGMNNLSFTRLYLEKANESISQLDFSSLGWDRLEVTQILKWLRIKQFYLGTMDTLTFLYGLPRDVVYEISTLLIAFSSVTLPQQILSPFWPHIYANFESKFYFLKDSPV